MAYGINASGQVVGYADTTGNAAYARLPLQRLDDDRPGHTRRINSDAYGINASGQVVGNAYITGTLLRMPSSTATRR